MVTEVTGTGRSSPGDGDSDDGDGEEFPFRGVCPLPGTVMSIPPALTHPDLVTTLGL